ncbi:MAG: Ger(x)C family spore germination C-terminal domain-containing protein [Candidatus Coprovivens sp.]
MKKIIFIIGIVLLISGCYDYRELNDMSIVSGIGIDYVDNQYKVIFEITESKKDGSSTEISTSIVVGSDSNISKAFDIAKNKTDKDVYLEHIELLVISKSLGKHGINECLDYIIRDTSINSNYLSVIADNPEVILKQVKDNKSMSQTIKDTVIYTQGNTSIDDLDILASKYITGRKDIALPYVYLDSDNINYNSVYYFNGDKIVDEINQKMYSFLVLDTTNTLFTRNGNTIKVYSKKISTDIKDNTITINIKVNGQISKINKDINLKDTDIYNDLEILINKQIKEETIKFIDTTLNKESDLLGFKDIYYKKYKKKINSFNYKVNVDTTISKNGSIYEVLNDK